MANARQLFYLPKTRNKSEVEVENILQPFNRSSGLVCKDLDQLWTSLVSGGFEGIFVESLDAVLNTQFDLRAGEGTVDTGSSLGRVATEES